MLTDDQDQEFGHSTAEMDCLFSVHQKWCLSWKTQSEGWNHLTLPVLMCLVDPSCELRP